MNRSGRVPTAKRRPTVLQKPSDTNSNTTNSSKLNSDHPSKSTSTPKDANTTQTSKPLTPKEIAEGTVLSANDPATDVILLDDRTNAPSVDKEDVVNEGIT